MLTAMRTCSCFIGLVAISIGIVASDTPLDDARDAAIAESRDRLGAAIVVEQIQTFTQKVRMQDRLGGADVITSSLDGAAFQKSLVDGSGAQGEFEALQAGHDAWRALQKKTS